MYQHPPLSLRRSTVRSGQDNMRAARLDQAERLSGVHLDLRLGNPISLRPLFDELSYQGHIVGQERFQYFMVQARLPLETLNRLQNSPAMAARFSLGGMAYSFYTNLISRVTTPAPVFFLSHPESVQRVLLRRSRRVRVSIPCSLHGAFGDYQGMVVDMDATGCRCNVRSQLNSPLRRARPGEVVVLNCNLLQPGAPFTTPIVLRRVEEDRGRISLGGQFEGVNPLRQRQLEDYMQCVESLADE